MTTIRYDIGAAVQLLQPAPGGLLGGGAIWSGTLAGAIRHVMAMNESERARTSIALDSDPGVGKTWLDFEEIERISRRPDFPPVDDDDPGL
jgi:hypothetical protein